MTNAIVRLAASVALAASFSASAAESATFSIKALTPESAMKAATAALAKCRADGYQVAVAIVDRSASNRSTKPSPRWTKSRSKMPRWLKKRLPLQNLSKNRRIN